MKKNLTEGSGFSDQNLKLEFPNTKPKRREIQPSQH